MALRIVFMGTPDFAVPTLNQLVDAGHTIVAVYTQPPRPAGRGQDVRKSPVHQAADGFGIPVFTPMNFKDAADLKAFADHNADVGIIVAYGLLLPELVLEAPRYGCLNLHGSMLPRWRGAAPIQRAIMAGDTKTGVMVMQMEKGLDTGPVAMTAEIAIGPDMTAGELHDQMMVRGAQLMAEALTELEQGNLKFVPQAEEGATYAKKIDKAEARIDWNQNAQEVHNLVRGLSPFPGAWLEIELSGKPVRIKVLRAHLGVGKGSAGTILDDALTVACATGAVQLTSVQRQGKGVMDANSFVRGAGSLTSKVVN